MEAATYRLRTKIWPQRRLVYRRIESAQQGWLPSVISMGAAKTVSFQAPATPLKILLKLIAHLIC